jgi:transcription elongation factor/antiterminator RfaH
LRISEPCCQELDRTERWYVVHTHPHKEGQAGEHLRNQDFCVFLPRYVKSRRHARKFEIIRAPLFPRYMFIALDLTRDRWRSVNGTYGVDRLLMRAGIPEAVPQGLVEQLLESANGDDVISFIPTLKEGQAIRVTAGPFADLLGRLERLDDKGRVQVLLDMMGGTVSVKLSPAHVAPN